MIQQTEEQKKKLNEQYGQTWELEIPTNEEGTEFTYGYLKKPTRIIVGAVLHQMGTNIVTAYDTILKSCLIKDVSDPTILTNDDYFYSAGAKAMETITFRNAEIKKN